MCTSSILTHNNVSIYIYSYNATNTSTMTLVVENERSTNIILVMSYVDSSVRKKFGRYI